MKATASVKPNFNKEADVANTVENDVEWLDHAVLQPAVRGTGKKLGKDANKDKRLLPNAHDHTWAQRIVTWYDWWKDLKEPPRDSCLHHFIESKNFNLFCVLVIVLNAGLIISNTNKGFEATSSGNTRDNDAASVEAILEYSFLCFYCIELILKLLVHRFYFFLNEDCSWNCLDFVLVLMSVIDLGLNLLLAEGGNFNVTFLRTFRLLKVSKVFRIFRALKFISELRLMLDCLLGCFLQLFWAVVLITFLICLFSIFFVQGFTVYMDDDLRGTDISDFERSDVIRKFGSVTSGMDSLFQAASGGRDWCEYYELIERVGGLYRFAFLFYVMFMMISVMNIVTSIFVDRAMKLAKPTEDQLVAEKERENLDDEKWLIKMLEDLKIDADCDGNVNYDELKTCMSDVKIREHFDARGISFEDTHMFYQMLVMANQTTCSSRRGIDLKSFITGAIRLKGPASNVDLHTLAFEVKLMHRAHRDLHVLCQEQFNKFDNRLYAVLSRASAPGPAAAPASPSSNYDSTIGLESRLRAFEQKVEKTLAGIEEKVSNSIHEASSNALKEDKEPSDPENFGKTLQAIEDSIFCASGRFHIQHLMPINGHENGHSNGNGILPRGPAPTRALASPGQVPRDGRRVQIAQGRPTSESTRLGSDKEVGHLSI
jgi:hypothetical protein